MCDIDGKSLKYLIFGSLLGAVGFAVFVGGFAYQWQTGGFISIISILYYTVGLAIMTVATIPCLHYFDCTCGKKGKKPKKAKKKK